MSPFIVRICTNRRKVFAPSITRPFPQRGRARSQCPPSYRPARAVQGRGRPVSIAPLCLFYNCLCQISTHFRNIHRLTAWPVPPERPRRTALLARGRTRMQKGPGARERKRPDIQGAPRARSGRNGRNGKPAAGPVKPWPCSLPGNRKPACPGQRQRAGKRATPAQDPADSAQQQSAATSRR